MGSRTEIVLSDIFSSTLLFNDSTLWVRKQIDLTEELGRKVDSLVVDVNKLDGKIENLDKGISAQIFDLNDPAYKLKHSISAIITKENDIYFAESVDFDVYGEGVDEKEAINDLKRALLVFHTSLYRPGKKLSSQMKAKHALLKKIITRT